MVVYDQKPAMKVAIINGLLNVLLAVVKLTVGWTVASNALISDGFHSVADVFSTVIVMIGIAFSRRRIDAKHPYGYERLECVAAVVLAIVIGVTGGGIGMTSCRALFFDTSAPSAIGGVAVVVAIGSIATKEAMFRYTRYVARKTGFTALEADAWHQRVDALSSIGGFIGIMGVRCGVPLLDPIAGVMISLLILKAAVSIFADAMRKMTDRACEESFENEIQNTVEMCEGVTAVEELKTRLFGSRVYVELTVTIDGELSARNAFGIVETVQSAVMSTFDVVKACSVHLHPL